MVTKPSKANGTLTSESVSESLEKDRIRLSLSEELTNIGCWEWKIQNNQLWWSEKVYEILGLDSKSFKPDFDKFLSIIHPDDSDKVNSAIKNSLQSGEKYLIDHRIIRPDGTQRTLIEQGEVVFDGSKPDGMIGIVLDVTKDRAKDKLISKQTTELQLQAEMLELAHDTIFIHDLNGKILFWNKGAEQTYGWQKSEALGRIVHSLLKTEFTESLFEIQAKMSLKSVWDGELVHTTKDGQKINVESRWVLNKSWDGKTPAILEIDRDITKRKLAEKKSRQAQKFSESIIETIQESLVVLDSELKIVTANKSFYELFKIKPANARNKYIYELSKNQWDIAELKILLEEVLPDNTSFKEYEIKYLPSDENEKTLLLNARRIYNNKKKTEMILLAMQDITKLKNRENEIRHLTEKLLMAEEHQRQKIATVLHDSIGQILAFSIRELKTLIKTVDEKTYKSLSVVCQEISNAIHQTRQLTTDLSSPTLHSFGLEAGIEELADQFKQKYNINCNVRFQDKAKSLPKNIEIVFYNIIKELLHNIAKHANASNVQIDLIATENEINLMVIDDGDGFEINILDQADFEKNNFGLFSIRQRLKNLGGKINVESEIKKGTKVIINAPLFMKS